MSGKKDRSGKAKPNPAKDEVRIEYAPGTPAVRRGLIVVAALYIFVMFMEGVGASPTSALYRPFLSFARSLRSFPARRRTASNTAPRVTPAPGIRRVDVRPFSHSRRRQREPLRSRDVLL